MPRVRADNDARYALRSSFVDENGDVLEAPIVIGSSSEDPRISDTDINNWNTAYGWGDHSTQNYALTTGDTFTGEVQINARLDVGTGSNSDHEIRIYKGDNNVSDHIQFYNGTTRVGEIGCEDTSWLRINQETAKNIYTPRYIRADNGFFVDGSSKGINGSGNFVGGTITGASDANVSNWDTAYGWGNHASAGYLDSNFNVATGSSSKDPNTTTDSHFLTNNANAPFGSIYSHIQNHWWSAVGGNVSQHATSYNGSAARFAYRHRYNGTWTPWVEVSSSPVQSGSGGGNYGSVYIDGGAVGGYEGYSIGGRAVFMHNNSTTTGIYNDVNNHWLFSGIHNGESRMYHAGNKKIYTYSSGGRVTGNLLASSDVYAYYSDERLKEITGYITNPLEKIGAIDTFYYKHNEKALELGYEGDEEQVGVSAQSVQKVLPHVIGRAPIDDDGEGGSVTGEDYITVQYHRIVPLLIEGIKELTSELEACKLRIQELENDR